MTTLILKSGALNTKITATGKALTKLNDNLAICAASTFYHAMKHRDPTLLNRFYAMLPDGYKATFKRWIGNEAIKSLSEMILDCKVSDLPFTMKNDEFLVKKETVDKTEHLAKHVETECSEGGDVRFGYFMDINPDKVTSPFDVLKIDKMLQALLAKAKKKGAEVSPTTLAALAESVALFEQKAKAEIELAKSKEVLNANVKAVKVPPAHMIPVDGAERPVVH